MGSVGSHRRLAAVAVASFSLGVGAIGLTSCGSDDEDPPAGLQADAALTALVGWAVDGTSPSTTADDAALPVVYIAPLSGESFEAGVQAAVVANTDGEATVRFADDRTEAIDDTTDEQSVHDEGVLLVVGGLADEPIGDEIEVERYRSADDSEVFVVSLAASDGTARITSATPE